MKLSQNSEQESKLHLPSLPTFFKALQSVLPQMLNKRPIVLLTAVLAMKPMVKQESTPKESDISALTETSVSLKTSNSTNSLTLEKPLLVEPSKTLPVSSTTLVQTISEISVLSMSMPAQQTELVLGLVLLPVLLLADTLDQLYFLILCLLLSRKHSQNYSLCYILTIHMCIIYIINLKLV
jgi:hypothetical protein